MHAPTKSSPIAWTPEPAAAADADLLVLAWFEGDRVDALPGLDQATSGDLGRALISLEFTAKPYEVYVAPVAAGSWPARRVGLIGAGSRASLSPTAVRRLATAAGLAARQRRVSSMAFACPSSGQAGSDTAAMAQAAAEGLTLAEFQAATFKTTDPPPTAIPSWTLIVEGGGAEVGDAVLRGRIIGESCNCARDLTNEPGNVLTPRTLARSVGDVAREGGISVEVLDQPRLEALGMGLLLGVGRGSAEPPCMVVLRYDPPGAPAEPVLGLVGKGITFDTGGISIKPADGMDKMKDDMAGGAAVAAAMRAIGRLGAPIRVIGVIPIAENMPGGRAFRPGDVLRSADGKTVEIVNTDAEGRLILGDGLWQARQLGATHLVTVATLTGAVVVALGKSTTGLFGAPETWVQHVRRLGDGVGDSMWQLPLVDDYRDQLKSEIADFTNSGGRPGGSITAALFLREFTAGQPWVHLDIAGTAWADDARPYMPKGPTGVAVRTLIEIACRAETGS